MTTAFWGYVPFRKQYARYHIPKNYSENFVDYFLFSKSGMTKSMSTQKLFHRKVVRCKPPIEKTVICYLESELLKVEIRLIREEINQF